ncbi:MAG: electron transport complex subunit RsxC [Planctomycetota bacterium]
MSQGTRDKARTFRHGVHPPDRKEVTETKETVRLPFPEKLVIPLSQHTGAPARAIVKKRQAVTRGELIAEAGGFVSVPMHSPITGTVEKVDLARLANGAMGPAIHLKTDPEADQTTAVGEPRDAFSLSGSDLVEAVQRTGMVGLGGAAFPTHVKLAIPEGKHVDTLIANGCECEPYLTTDHRLMLERGEDLFAGMRIALRGTGAERAIIGIEENKSDAIQALEAGKPRDLPLEVRALQVKYPQGAEKMLINTLTGREVPSGGLPHDAGAAVFNVATLAQLGRLLPRGEGLIERGITVSGAGIEQPGNYIVPTGTPVRFVLEQLGLSQDARQVVLGGPMMGQSIASLDVPLIKGVSGILVFTEHEVRARIRKVHPCIRCGQCLKACPVFLNPSRMGSLSRKEEYEVLEKEYHLNDCFECGSCTFICPSHIPLVQYFRMAKAKNRERKAKS